MGGGATSAPGRWGALVGARACFFETVTVLAVFNVARTIGIVGPPLLSVIVLTAVLVLIAWHTGASRADLGLELADAGSGVRFGLAAFGVVLLVLVVGAVLPGTDGYVHDTRAQIGGGRLAYELLVVITLLTAIPEEFAFRGVLLGSATRLWGPWRATLITSLLFGLWHIGPTLHTTSDNALTSGASRTLGGQVALVVGSVAVTFIAGLGFSWLRLGSRSLIAPVLAHVATNGLALTVAWVATHSL